MLVPRAATALAPLALGLALLAAAPLAAQQRERCYGVAEAGANDGIGTSEQPGTSTIDYQGDAWIWVPVGECLTIGLPVAPDGTSRRGALDPLTRDLPS